MSESKSSKGGASVAKSLFVGDLKEENLFPFPKIREDERDTLSMVLESVDRFMGPKGEEYRRFDEKGEQPQEYLDELKAVGLFSLIIPGEFDGLGLSNTGYSRVLQQIARYDSSTTLTVGAHSSIGMKALLLFGTDAQKKRYLPRLASGELIAAFCLTEPGSGSDAASIKTSAEKQSDGNWILNGDKIWITNGGTAGFYTVFARTESEHGKISAFIVEREWEGVSTGPKEDKMGIRASCTTTVSFTNVRVPADCLIGEEGKGFKVAMAVLNNGRTGLGGGCVGAMKALIGHAMNQAKQRKQFGRSIAEFDLIREKIAHMTTLCFAAESVVSMVGHYIDSGYEDCSVEAAISKILASESLWIVADEALQIAGGNGFMREFPYERVVRDSRINRIFEGTNEILRLYVGLSGMKDAGDALKDTARGLGEIFNDPIKGFGVLSGYASKKVGQYTTFGRPRLSKVSPVLQAEAAACELGAAKLAQAVESVLRKHGKGIIGKQLVTKRIADVTMDLFVGLCVLSRVTAIIAEKGESNAHDEIRIAKVFTGLARTRITNNLRALIKNEDAAITSLADSMFERGEYPWDIL